MDRDGAVSLRFSDERDLPFHYSTKSECTTSMIVVLRISLIRLRRKLLTKHFTGFMFWGFCPPAGIEPRLYRF
jgi:hypothetical protein